MKRIVLTLIAVAVAGSASARPITFDDLYGMPRSREARISPNGEQIVFVLTTTDPKTNTRESHIWLMNADGSSQRQLTQGTGEESSPRWTVDGKSILFLAGRNDQTQVWRLRLDGGESYPVTAVPTEVSGFTLSPDGRQVLIVTRVFPDCASDSCNRARLAGQSKNPNGPQLYDHLLFRHYDRWDDGRV